MTTKIKPTVMKYLLRLLVLPFLFIILFVFLGKKLFVVLWYFLKYGGEVSTYGPDINPKTIADVYEIIQKDVYKSVSNEFIAE